MLQFLAEESMKRSQWSAARSYMNSERTLLLLVHVSVALMVFGIAIGRFGLLVRRPPWPAMHGSLDAPSWESVALILLGILVLLLAGARYLSFIFIYRHNRHMPLRFGAFLPSIFAFLLAIYGVALLGVLLAR
ncbi:MAG: DUF202 domain-containing protein [Gammaproteobacteria bacterium]